MPHIIDPELGFVEFTFSATPTDGEPDAVIDVYHATELFITVNRRYMKELEDAGKVDEFSRSVLVRRWLELLFKPHPKVKVDKLSDSALAQVEKYIYLEVDRLKKKGSESDTPDSAGTTGSTASPTL